MTHTTADTLSDVQNHLTTIERTLNERERKRGTGYASPAIETAALKERDNDADARQALTTLKEFLGENADLDHAAKSINDNPRGIPREAQDARSALSTLATALDNHNLDSAFRQLSIALDPDREDTIEDLLRSDV